MSSLSKGQEWKQEAQYAQKARINLADSFLAPLFWPPVPALQLPGEQQLVSI